LSAVGVHLGGALGAEERVTELGRLTELDWGGVGVDGGLVEDGGPDRGAGLADPLSPSGRSTDTVSTIMASSAPTMMSRRRQ
jgi:hypothetical protein